jgi:enoyl-CoA hydratase/carnithine racemase
MGDETHRVDVRLDQREHGVVAFVTLDNQAKLNTLNRALMRKLILAVETASSRDDLRAMVLSGAGDKAFIGGADISEMAALDQDSAREFITLLHQVCESLRSCPAPVIARVDGYALGAGLEVAVSCDLRVASDRAKFGMPETKVGIPSVIEAALLPSLIGSGRARELLLLGEIIDAQTAKEWRLVERVVPPNEVDAEVEKVLRAIFAVGPKAARLQKSLMRQWENLPVEQAVAAGIEAFARAYETDEPRRLLSDFLNRKRSSMFACNWRLETPIRSSPRKRGPRRQEKKELDSRLRGNERLGCALEAVEQRLRAHKVRAVVHLAIDADSAGTRVGSKGGNHRLCLGDLRLRRLEHLVDDRYLRRMNGEAADEAVTLCFFRIFPQRLIVAEIDVDRFVGRGLCGGRAEQAEGARETIRLGQTAAGVAIGFGADFGREIFRAPRHADQSRGAVAICTRREKTRGGFDRLRQNPDVAFRQIGDRLAGGQLGIDMRHRCAAFRFGKQDRIRGAGDDCIKIAVDHTGFEAIHAHQQLRPILCAAGVFQKRERKLPRFGFAVRRD